MPSRARDIVITGATTGLTERRLFRADADSAVSLGSGEGTASNPNRKVYGCACCGYSDRGDETRGIGQEPKFNKHPATWLNGA